jgi:hypothetical protein
MAFSMTLAGLPIVAAPSTSQHAICSVDICHPAQAVNAVSVQCSLPLKTAPALQLADLIASPLPETITPSISLDSAPPVPPPPESYIV